MDIKNYLRQFGLTNSEISVYIFLLENGASTPPDVSRETKIARTNCYHILESLEERDLIESGTHGKRKSYVACDPDALLRVLDKKKESLQTILPDLRGLYKTQKNKPFIRFYEGIDQIEKIYLSSLEAEKIVAIGSSKKAFEVMPRFEKEYINRLKEKDVVFCDILSGPSKSLGGPEFKSVMRGLYDMKVLPQKYPECPTDVLIWNNNVALVVLENPIFGTVITNKFIADTFKVIFEVIWNNL